jgi:hypothetical protein
MVYQKFIDFKKTYDSVRREVLCNILIEFVIPRALAGLIKMRLNENMSQKFPIQKGLKEGEAVPLLLLNFALKYAIRRVQENQKD